VVAGIRTPQHLTVAGKQANKSTLPAMEEVMPAVFKQLDDVRHKLERTTATCRTSSSPCSRASSTCCRPENGKRTAQAALKIAVDLCSEGLIDQKTAVARVEPASLDQLLHPRLDPKAKKDVIARGLPGKPRCCQRQGRVLRRRGRGIAPPRAMTSSWCASRPVRRTSTACMPRSAS